MAIALKAQLTYMYTAAILWICCFPAGLERVDNCGTRLQYKMKTPQGQDTVHRFSIFAAVQHSNLDTSLLLHKRTCS